MQGLAGWADGERATSHGEAGSLGPSPRLASCVGTVRTDYNRDDQCYVLHLAHVLEADMVASSLTTGIVKLFSPECAWCWAVHSASCISFRNNALVCMLAYCKDLAVLARL